MLPPLLIRRALPRLAARNLNCRCIIATRSIAERWMDSCHSWKNVCAPFLVNAQNSDGGWGYRPGEASRVEATSWAFLASLGFPSAQNLSKIKDRAGDWLVKNQQPDGSWPAAPGFLDGGWVTSLACLALAEQESAAETFARGTRWLIDSWPGEGNWWWRLRQRILGRKNVRQDFALRGWSWTRGTSSWVEPTSLALLALRRASRQSASSELVKRRELAEAMLFDRMCPGGGWNCGNPMVYGVAGQPFVGQTVWALLALGNSAGRTEVKQSLDWLEHEYPNIKGPASLSLAHLCLRNFGRSPRPLAPDLESSYAENRFLNQVPAMAFAAIALSPARDWYSSPRASHP